MHASTVHTEKAKYIVKITYVCSEYIDKNQASGIYENY